MKTIDESWLEFKEARSGGVTIHESVMKEIKLTFFAGSISSRIETGQELDQAITSTSVDSLLMLGGRLKETVASGLAALVKLKIQ